MAKRTRGSNRPGQRQSARLQSQPASRPSNVRMKYIGRTHELPAEVQEKMRWAEETRDEEARAAELESQIVSRERAADTERARARDRAKIEPARPGRAGGQGLLAARAAQEYDYLRRDIRRIVMVGGMIAVILAVLYVLVDIGHIFTIS